MAEDPRAAITRAMAVNGGRSNHDLHWAAAVAEQFCPNGHGQLVPYQHSCAAAAAVAERWLWCESCRVGFIPRPEGKVGTTPCSPDGYCAWQELYAREAELHERQMAMAWTARIGAQVRLPADLLKITGLS